ncbi:MULTISPECIES: flagellar basal body rod protein FlgG [Shouchella]|uniref:Flagellar basal body rod protein FlgG n=3 Tax=Shouchella TaxID=2893057 RepID=A0A4Y7WQL5_9BACI|nr:MULTISPECIES: flagellar basal body rod protein FlgG [Shouchella]RQW20671.1 flagellar basal body rod protein FlgG [Bacillus sp. C1-1]MBG9784318.1 flagellar basal body rod protein FlgG [Shouchella lehensis]MED4127290.1 flagellar basal body rod protein FlgG [Shouchella miscanthi]TES50691.1 flagellar basal body rod protein FlgG [Shouchella lehensis]WDF03765.1 flagellar basal body rod protein FlgG [Shouchella hunanensis]
MIRSMYSGISGMKGFQTKLDVIGNNIANVNTHGFKKGRVMFQDLMSQQMQSALAPGANQGGVNPQQVGTGSTVGAIDTVHGEGPAQYTGRSLDLMMNGAGFFAVQSNGETYYTRAGNFYIDSNNNIVNSSGAYLLNQAGERIEVPEDATEVTIDSEGTINFVGSDAPGTTLQVATFANPDGLTKVGGNLFSATAASGAPNITDTNGAGEVQSGFLEMSNVDLTDEFTEMIVAQRGFQANSRVITTSDEILQEIVNLKR